MDSQLERLVAQSEIEDLLYRYARTVDSCDWSDLRALFTEEIERDFSSAIDFQPDTMQADDWVAECKSILPGFTFTHHTISNIEYDLKGNEARVTAYLTADHGVIEADVNRVLSVSGYYQFGVIKESSGWLINSIKLVNRWQRGDDDIYSLAAERVASGNSRR